MANSPIEFHVRFERFERLPKGGGEEVNLFHVGAATAASQWHPLLYVAEKYFSTNVKIFLNKRNSISETM